MTDATSFPIVNIYRHSITKCEWLFATDSGDKIGLNIFDESALHTEPACTTQHSQPTRELGYILQQISMEAFL